MIFLKIIIYFIFFCVPMSSFGDIIQECAIVNHAKTLGAVDPKLVLAVVQVESSCNSKAMNKDQHGLMQIKLSTAKMLGFKGKSKDLLNWKKNLKFGIKYLNEKLFKHKSKQAAVAAYNAGTVYVRWAKFVNQDYVDSVMREYKKYTTLNCKV